MPTLAPFFGVPPWSRRYPPLLGLASVALVCANCAASGGSEISPLREEVSALREAHARDRKRLEALELQVDAQQVELRRRRGENTAVAAGGETEAAAMAPGELPAGGLPVLRLQPRATHDLPPVPTGVAVREPSPEVLAELERPPASGTEESSGNRDEAEALFKTAFEKLKTGELVGAASLFQTFVARFPKHPAADNALLDAGIADYGLRRYAEALEVFSELARRYPAGDAVAEGLWRAADCQVKLGDSVSAEATYRILLRRYPASPEAAKADAQLAQRGHSNPHVAATAGGSP